MHELRPAVAQKPSDVGLWSNDVEGESSEDRLSEDTLREYLQPQRQSPLSRAGAHLKRVGLALLPTPVLVICGQCQDTSRAHDATSYLDGLRGLASFVVFSEHAAMHWHPHMFDEYRSKPAFMQLPIVRLLYSGNAMVAIFFVISGFALSLKPLQHIRDQDWERLHISISSAILRRGFRIVLPPAVVSVMVMVGVRLHLFDQQYSGAGDMALGHPHYLPSFFAQIVDVLEYILAKLIYPYEWLAPLPNTTQSDYAPPLYTIPQELWSSLLLFVTIAGLSRVRTGVRILAITFIALFSAWCMRREISLFLAGMAMAEAHVLKQHRRTQQVKPARLSHILSNGMLCFVLTLGLWMASIPHTHGSYGSSTPGYRTISKLIPWNSNVYSLGAVLIVWSVSQLVLLQTLFSTSFFRYLGRISFALYLVHWPMLAAWGWDLVPAVWRITGRSTNAQYEAGYALSFAIMCPFMVWAADLFCRFVDEPCIRVARAFETDLVTRRLPLPD